MTRSIADDEPMQVLFMGTGTSTGLPIACCLANVEPHTPAVAAQLAGLSLTTPPQAGQYDPAGPWPKNVACSSCRAAVDTGVPDGWKNRRGNPGLVLRKRNAAGKWRNVVVDVGKTFREQSIRLFPRWGVQSVDAVLITHGHADAMNGLDDLREWCVRQGRAIPIYLNRATYEAVARGFPYLVDKSQASGGGDIPSLSWNIIEDESDFEVEGIQVTTLPVHHGRYFAVPPKAPAGAAVASAPAALPPLAPPPTPFICLGYVFDRDVVYLSDLNAVPESTWERMTAAIGPARIGHEATPDSESAASPNGHADGAAESLTPAAAAAVAPAAPSTGPSASAHITPVPSASRPAVLIVDTLWPDKPHASHISFAQALSIALRLRPQATYILGMTHPTTHYEWEELGRAVAGADGRAAHPDARRAREAVRKVWACDEMRAIADDLAAWQGRVEPAWDGLGLEVGGSDARWRVLSEKEGSKGGWFY